MEKANKKRYLIPVMLCTMLILLVAMSVQVLADNILVSTWEQLEAAMGTAQTDTVTLTKNISKQGVGVQLNVAGTKTLDLNGYDLTITVDDDGSATGTNCIYITSGAKLTIQDSTYNSLTSTNKLSVQNNDDNSNSPNVNAGINVTFGELLIKSGIVEATGGEYGAGIGGGDLDGSGGIITISGGTVTATGGDGVFGGGGAGIGGGWRGAGGTITITGGTIEANGRNNGAGIGGGYYGAGGTITISGGTIEATGGAGGDGIGNGYGGSGSTINISGGHIIAIGDRALSAEPETLPTSYKYKTNTSKADPLTEYILSSTTPYTWDITQEYVEILVEEKKAEVSNGAMMAYMYNNVINNQQYTIRASTDTVGGTITPEGRNRYKIRENATVIITPDEGYEIDTIMIDDEEANLKGRNVKKLDDGSIEYTFKNLTASHTIVVSFKKLPAETP